MRYNLTASANATDIRFLLSNYDPDPSQAVVESVIIGQSPNAITTGEGTFFLRYRADDETAWRKMYVFFDAEEGIAEVDISVPLQSMTASMDYRLVHLDKPLAYGTITLGESEGVSEPPCDGEPIVDVVLERLQPTLSLAVQGGGAGASFEASLYQVSGIPGGETWGISAVSVGGDAGAGYTDGSKLAVTVSGRVVEESAADMRLNVTNGTVESVTINNSGEYYMTGGVESLELVYGGAFYPFPACKYTWTGCETCLPNSHPYARRPMQITFEAGVEEHSLVAKVDGTTTILHATTPADGGDWDELTFGKTTFYPGVKSIEVVAGGSGYTSPPTVTISGDGEGAEAVATVRGYVDSITLTSQGDDFYETSPTVTITGGGGEGAAAIASGGFGGLKIFLSSGGNGYTSPPTVTISGGGGSGAKAVATVRQAVDSITVTKSGSNYTAPPVVTLSGGGGGTGAVAVATLERTPVGCHTSGTATLEPISCSTPTEIDKCEMPKQISLALEGMGDMLVWGTNTGGAVSFQGPLTEECGLDPDGTVVRLFSGASGNQSTIWVAGILANVSNVILDLTAEECDGYVYKGYLPSSPRGARTAYNEWDYTCGGDLSHEVTVNIDPIGIDIAVEISPPTKAEGMAATAEVTKVDANGAVTGITLLTQGFGYAAEEVERVEPEIVAGVVTVAGTGAALSVTLSKVGTDDEAYWLVDSVEVSSGGTDYEPGALIAFSTADEVYSEAFAYIQVPTTEPTLSASVDGGSGAVLTPTLVEQTDFYGNAMWAVHSVAVSSGGTGYTDGSPVVFTVDDGVARANAYATVTTGRTQPELLVDVSSATGTGAAFSVVLEESNNSWYVAGVTVTSGGTGYDPEYDYIVFSTDDEEAQPAYGWFDVDINGTITGVTVYSGGAYFRSTGVIESVSVGSGGEYYKSDGTISAVVVQDGGQYWRLQGTGYPLVDVPTVTITCPSGKDAEVVAIVDYEIGSPTFGQITELAITDGGEGYVIGGAGWILTISLLAFTQPRDLGFLHYFSHLDGGALPDRFPFDEVDRVQPSVAADVVTVAGSEAALSVTLVKVGAGSDAYWAVTSVQVNEGGVGYESGDLIAFSTNDEIGASAAAYVLVPPYIKPTVSASAAGGTGAELQVNLVKQEEQDIYGNSLWEVDSIDVTNGGTGYINEVPVVFTVDDGLSKAQASATITVGPTGIIESVTVLSRGEYYKKSTGTISSVVVTAGGQYWRPGEADATDPNDCFNFYNRYTPLANRVVAGNCPNVLLSREYAMCLPITHDQWPTRDFGNVGEAEFCMDFVGGFTEVFYELGNGPFNITLSPA